MTERTLAVNTPTALAAMMRHAQSDPEFREQLAVRGIPFGALASALVTLQTKNTELAKALRHYGSHHRDCEIDRKRQYTLALPQTCGCGLDAAIEATAK